MDQVRSDYAASGSASVQEPTARDPNASLRIEHQALATKSLTSLLHKALTHLEFSGCKKLRREDVAYLPTSCPNLQELSIVECTELPEIGIWGWRRTQPLICLALKRLNISMCRNLKGVQLISPSLNSVICNDNSSLQQFTIESVFEVEIAQKECPILRQGVQLQLLSWEDLQKKGLSPKLATSRDFFLSAVRRDSGWIEHASDEFKGDREIVLASVSKNGSMLKHASEKVREDREVVLAAVTEYGPAFQYASDALKNDRGVLEVAVQQDIKVFRYASGELVLAVIQEDSKAKIYGSNNFRKDISALEHAHNDLKKDRKFIFDAVGQNGYALKYAHEDLKKDREIVLTAVRRDGGALEYAHADLKKDREIVLAAVIEGIWSFDWAHDDLKNDREIVLAAINQNAQALRFASEELKNDKEIVRTAMNRSLAAFQYAAAALRNNRKFVLSALRRNDYSSKCLAGNTVIETMTHNRLLLSYAGDELKYDRAFILDAMTYDRMAVFGFASDELKNDVQFILDAVMQDAWAFSDASEIIKNNKEVALAVVRQNGKVLQAIGSSLKNDREIALAALNNDIYALEFVSDELKKDIKFVIAVINLNKGFSFETLNLIKAAVINNKKDKEFALPAVGYSGELLEYVDDVLKKDKDIVLAAVKQNRIALQYASAELQKDKDVIAAAKK